MIKRKLSFRLSLLILFITGLNSGFITAQSNGKYCYDSLEVLEISNIILENDMLRENEKEFIKRDSLFSLKTELLQSKITGLEKIINLKDEQLRKIEINSAELTRTGWKWWQYTLACIGAVTFGFTAGVIYNN